jgi:RHS repeat-associated protein
VQQDADWNVTALVNASGTVVERYVYDPYGNMTVLSATWGTLSGSAYAWIYGHQGGRFDATTGLYYFRHRDLSPVLERWIEADPLRFAAGQENFYQYVGNAPSYQIDPSGLDSAGGFGGGLGGAIGGAIAGGLAGGPLGWVGGLAAGAIGGLIGGHSATPKGAPSVDNFTHGFILGGAIGLGIGAWIGPKMDDWFPPPPPSEPWEPAPLRRPTIRPAPPAEPDLPPGGIKLPDPDPGIKWTPPGGGIRLPDIDPGIEWPDWPKLPPEQEAIRSGILLGVLIIAAGTGTAAVPGLQLGGALIIVLGLGMLGSNKAMAGPPSNLGPDGDEKEVLPIGPGLDVIGELGRDKVPGDHGAGGDW